LKIKKLPAKNEILGLVVHDSYVHPRVYVYCFDKKVREITSLNRISMWLSENSIVLVQKSEFEHSGRLKKIYSKEEISILKKKGILKDLPKILKEKERIKHKVPHAEIFKKLKLDKFDIMKYYEEA